jgi:hypothetical protein
MRRLVLIASLIIFQFPTASAELITVSTYINSVRVESSYGFVGFSKLSSVGCPGTDRGYFNFTSEYQKIGYSTALAAYMAKKPVRIRIDTSVPVYGACGIYDILVLDNCPECQ